MPRSPQNVGICLLSADGLVVYGDQAFERAVGVEASNGARLADLLPWATDALKSEGRFVAPAGDLVLLVNRTDLDSVAAVVRVERLGDHGAERDLRIARGLLTSLLDASPVTILALDMQKSVTMWNAAAERMFGWTADEVVGKPYPLVPEGEWTRFEALFDRVVVGGEGFTDVEGVRERKDGSPIDLRIHTAPMRDADGRVTGAMAILEDLSEQRRLETQVRHSHKMEAVGRLAGGVAHDFNNLLTVILGVSEVLTNDPKLDARTREGVVQIRECGEQARELTAQLLAFSRRQVLRPEPVDMCFRVRSITGMLMRLIGERIEMKLELTIEPLPIRVDTGQFDQMLVNLVVNARDAMKEGGELLITTAVSSDSRHATLEVRDTGQGVPPSVLPHIFDPFFTTKRFGHGTGLGLATVHGVVEQSGGTITVDSEEGVGTTFRVLLPLTDSPAQAARPRPKTELPRGDETILLVEDDEQVRAITHKMLDSLGYDVRTAVDGNDAFEQLRGGLEAALIITDLAMPKLGGVQLAARARADFPQIPIIFISANLDDRAVRLDVDAGLAVFLQKPFSLDGLSHCVRGCLDERTV